MPETEDAARLVTRLWWLWLVTGIAWIVASLVILQFDEASITTVGIIIGIMFAFAALQQFVYAAFAPTLAGCGRSSACCSRRRRSSRSSIPRRRSPASPTSRASCSCSSACGGSSERSSTAATSTVWWLGLIAGILMVILAFWTSGQFFIEKAYTLLVFAGIWALMQGIVHICAAFAVRAMRDEI